MEIARRVIANRTSAISATSFAREMSRDQSAEGRANGTSNDHRLAIQRATARRVLGVPADRDRIPTRVGVKADATTTSRATPAVAVVRVRIARAVGQAGAMCRG